VIDLRPGDWRDALQDVEVDTLIADPPYGQRTHEGSDGRLEDLGRSRIDYGHWTPEDVAEFVVSWSPRTRGWMCGFTSDDLIPVWRAAYAKMGRYDFAPVPVLQHRPRLGGDGPGSCAVYLMVARPRTRPWSAWGSLPGFYMAPVERGGIVNGAKPLQLMRAIVRDYSRAGELVCDPCAGSATTLLAAAIEHRRAIGSELDPQTFELATSRIAKGYTPALVVSQGPDPVQHGLGLEAGE
jgi:site-specific DNA-methyltransferase (adenine-specific)